MLQPPIDYSLQHPPSFCENDPDKRCTSSKDPNWILCSELEAYVKQLFCQMINDTCNTYNFDKQTNTQVCTMFLHDPTIWSSNCNSAVYVKLPPVADITTYRDEWNAMCKFIVAPQEEERHEATIEFQIWYATNICERFHCCRDHTANILPTVDHVFTWLQELCAANGEQIVQVQIVFCLIFMVERAHLRNYLQQLLQKYDNVLLW